MDSSQAAAPTGGAGAPAALRSPAAAALFGALSYNYKGILKEVYNKHLHVDPTFDTQWMPGASSGDPVQFRARVMCPAIQAASTVVLHEFTKEGYGRSKKDAEQEAARLAVEHIADVAPALGIVLPPRPPGSTATGTSVGAGGSATPAPSIPSSVPSSLYGSPPASVYHGGAGTANGLPGATQHSTYAAHAPPGWARPSGGAAAATGQNVQSLVETFSAEELAAELLESRRREGRLRDLLRSIWQAIEDELA